MKTKTILSAMIVMMTVSATVIVVSDESSAENIDETTNFEGFRMMSVIGHEWHCDHVPHYNPGYDYAPSYLIDGYTHYLDRTIFVYFKDSDKDREFREWIYSDGKKGEINISDESIIGRDYNVYAFVSFSAQQLIEDIEVYSSGSSKWDILVTQDIIPLTFGMNNDFKVSSPNNLKLFIKGQFGWNEYYLNSENAFENKVLKDGKPGYRFDVGGKVLWTFVTGNLDYYATRNIEQLKDAYISDISFTAENQWESDGNGSGMKIMMVAFVFVGVLAIAMGFVLRRKPAWSD